jgi:hypothetical protein
MSGHKEIRISSVECVVNLCESHVTGFNIKENLKQGFVNLFAGKPTVIPCEKFDYMYFGGHYNSSGIDTTVTMNFVNAKEAIILCPREINNITCYQNPLMTEAYIQFDGMQYPPQPANFLSNEFLKSNMQCAGWSDIFPEPEEGEVSQAVAPPQILPVRGRNNSDHTLWFWIIPLERRNCNEYLFEGLDKQSVCVKFSVKFIPTQDKYVKTTGCLDNLWLLNENDREPNRPDQSIKEQE